MGIKIGTCMKWKRERWTPRFGGNLAEFIGRMVEEEGFTLGNLFLVTRVDITTSSRKGIAPITKVVPSTELRTH